MINVAIDGKKLFEWEGDAEAVARINEETTRIARQVEASPQALWQSTLFYIRQNRGHFSTRKPEIEMLILTSGLLSMPTQHPEHPGVFGDYLELWSFDFDIKIDPEDEKRFTVDVNGGFTAQGTA